MEDDLDEQHPIKRFNDRVAHYAQYRPDYPEAFFPFIESELGLTKDMNLADIGSGTGLFARHLLERGYRVTCVEPNSEMRGYAEKQLSRFPDFVSWDSVAEHTGLASRSIDCIFVAQAFHWMNPVAMKEEFLRILKPGGKIAICWMLARQDSAFLIDYEKLRQAFALNYKPVKRNDEEVLSAFYAPMRMQKKVFPFTVCLDLDGLKGLSSSVSFMPKPGQTRHTAMLASLEDLFGRHNQKGRVEMAYELIVYWNS